MSKQVSTQVSEWVSKQLTFGISEVARCEAEVKRTCSSLEVAEARPLGEPIAGLFFICPGLW